MERRGFLRSLGGFGLLAGFPSEAPATEDLTALLGDPSAPNFWTRLRQTFYLPPDYAYFNTGGLGASPRAVLEAVTHRMIEIETYPKPGHDLAAWWDVKAHCARLLGPQCTKESIALTSTTTEGLNTILNGLPFKAGDEVITSTHEHPALLVPLLNLAQRKGIEIRTFEPDLRQGAGNLARIEALLSRRSRLIIHSHITCTTGQIMPIREIGALARARGIWFALDGAQAVGALPFDVQEAAVDFYATSGHKWMLGPKRTGLLYVREEHRDILRPTVVGTYSDRKLDLSARLLEFDPTAQRYEFGTQNEALFVGLAAAADLLTTIGLEQMHAHNRRLSEHFVRGLGTIPGVQILSPAEESYRATMITFTVDGRDYREIAGTLHKRRYRVRPVGEAGLNGIRVSIHIYNSMAEVEGLLAEIRALS